MGLLNYFAKSNPVALQRLPTGSFTMDRHGQLIVSTLPSTFPEAVLHELGHSLLGAFAEARKAGLHLEQLVLRFGSLKVSARDLSGGAIVFFSPITLIGSTTQN